MDTNKTPKPSSHSQGLHRVYLASDRIPGPQTSKHYCLNDPTPSQGSSGLTSELARLGCQGTVGAGLPPNRERIKTQEGLTPTRVIERS